MLPVLSSSCLFMLFDLCTCATNSTFTCYQERGFFPLSAALLSSSVLRAQTGHAIDIFVDIASHLEAITLSLLFCRSGCVRTKKFVISFMVAGLSLSLTEHFVILLILFSQD